jgi:predicted nuclease of predicted toxin-antitoxin system
MLRLAADENFKGPVIRALRQRLPELDLIRVQDTGLGEADDPVLLEWAAREGRVLLTHDFATMIAFAYDLVLIATCSADDEWEGQVRFLPLR